MLALTELPESGRKCDKDVGHKVEIILFFFNLISKGKIWKDLNVISLNKAVNEQMLGVNVSWGCTVPLN